MQRTLTYSQKMKIKTSAWAIKDHIATAKKLALDLLSHPDATPDQLWTLHLMMVKNRKTQSDLDKQMHELGIDMTRRHML